MKILFMGGGPLFRSVLASLPLKQLSIAVALEETSPASDVDAHWLAAHGIPMISISVLRQTSCDILFLCGYGKIINPDDYCMAKQIVNLHTGVLPRYRGNSANVWAIWNDDPVGFTLHAVNKELDGGDIYAIWSNSLEDHETYLTVKEVLIQQLCCELPMLLTQIANRTIDGHSQRGASFIYCAKVRAADGNIRSWLQPSRDLLKLYQIYSRAAGGTGLYLSFRSVLYEIDRLVLLPNYLQCRVFGCWAGSVVNIHNNQLWIKTQDTAVGVELIGQPSDLAGAFRIGNRFDSNQL